MSWFKYAHSILLLSTLQNVIVVFIFHNLILTSVSSLLIFLWHSAILGMLEAPERTQAKHRLKRESKHFCCTMLLV